MVHLLVNSHAGIIGDRNFILRENICVCDAYFERDEFVVAMRDSDERWGKLPEAYYSYIRVLFWYYRYRYHINRPSSTPYQTHRV
jgi:hypothetical protein